MLHLISVVALALTATLASASEGPDSGLAIDMVTSRGTHMQFPFFLENLKSMDPQLRQLYNEDLEKVLAILKEFMRKQIMEPANMFTTSGRYISLASNLKSEVSAQEKRRRETGKRMTTGGVFNSAMKRMFSELMSRSSDIQKNLKQNPSRILTKESLLQNLNNFVDDLEEGIKSSPTSAYVNWMDAKMDDDLFIQRASELMAQLRIQGLSNMFKCIDTLLSFIALFSRSGKTV